MEVQYQAHRLVPVDVVAIHDDPFDEPWWLLVPPESAEALPTDLVVQLYREGMQIEQIFRDFKTPRLARPVSEGRDRGAEERTGRLLLAFCLAYLLAVILGSEPEATAAAGTLRSRVAGRVTGHDAWRLQKLGGNGVERIDRRAQPTVPSPRTRRFASH